VKGRRAKVPHRRRAALDGNHPVHVTVRIAEGVRLRQGKLHGALRMAFRGGKDRFGFRLVHYSIQKNHIHMICEADGARSLGKGMQGLNVRIARRVNGAMGRRGTLFAERYHVEPLTSPRQVRNTLVYVYSNWKKHGEADNQRMRDWFDTYTSARFFVSGWRMAPPGLTAEEAREPPVAEATRWLLSTGWRRHGLLLPSELPAAMRV
jgi:REP element-mobilizing transposase RayT